MTLTLVQCEFHTGKKTVVARIKPINRNYDADFRFLQKYLVLNPNSQAWQERAKPPGKLNVKTGPPLVEIMIFSSVLVSVFLRFSGCCHFCVFRAVFVF